MKREQKESLEWKLKMYKLFNSPEYLKKQENYFMALTSFLASEKGSNKMRFLLSFVFILLLFFSPVHVFAASATHIAGGNSSNSSSFNTSSVILNSNNLEVLTVTSRTGVSTDPNQPTVTGDNLIWVPINTTVYDNTSSSRRRLTVFRAMGIPTIGQLTISFGGQVQTNVNYLLDEISGIDTTGINGSGAIIQSIANSSPITSVSSITATLGAFGNTSNATFGAFGSSDDINSPTVDSGFTQMGVKNASNGGLNMSTVSEFKSINDTTVNFIMTSMPEVGVIGMEIKADSGIVLTPTPTFTPSPTPTGIPNPNKPDHIVVVVEENQKFQNMLRIGYFTQLATQGALMVNSFSLTHPSQPNYLALFSGSTQGLTDSLCPPLNSPYGTDNIGNQLLTNSFTFLGYAENMPSNPRSDCTNTNGYDAGHLPWIRFTNLDSTTWKTFVQFPTDFSTLPTVAFVTPDLSHDAHDGTIPQASDWLIANIENYRVWAMTHNSLLIITEDEDDDLADNQVYTVFVGQKIKVGIYNEQISHYNILSTIEDLYGLPHLNPALGITDIFK